jgi:hypothetical protein
MNILAIGNSFSQDALRYLHQIAKADGIHMKAVNLYIGGCSLERHDRNMKEDAQAYVYQLNGQEDGSLVSIREALLSESWDVVTMQQVSHLSVDYSTYQPYLLHLSDYIRQYAPLAEQRIHQTWAYEQGSERLTHELGYRDQYDMYVDLKDAYAKAATDLGGLTVIPCGTAFQNALRLGISKLHRDTFHASLGIGRYILSALWYESLSGKHIDGNTFCELDEPVDPKILALAKRCVRMTTDDKP